jgi:dTDP-4-amino-4,6-dideoxygalactose transaminase
MAAILIGLEPGDEVIMPSYTFVSTANAVVLRNATPVFVDIRPDTLNIDETLIEAAITTRTRAIFVVHYAGVCAEMNPIRELARKHGLMVVEDAAQALLSSYHGKRAGSLGDFGCFSFHETKNATCGEGGALTVSDPLLAERAFVIWEKGTNRRAFKLGQVDKYTWMDCGSSFLPSELTAAVLLSQLEEVDRFNAERQSVWAFYDEAFAELELAGLLKRPRVPNHCQHNSHLYYLVLESQNVRDSLISALRAQDIWAPFHYVPLHSAPAGLRYGRANGELPVTDRTSAGLLRLPLFAGMRLDEAARVVDAVRGHLVRAD